MNKYARPIIWTFFLVTVLCGCQTTGIKRQVYTQGEVPAVGEYVYVFDVISYFQSGQMKHVLVWKIAGEQTVRTAHLFGFCFSGLQNYNSQGWYLIQADPETERHFQPVKMDKFE